MPNHPSSSKLDPRRILVRGVNWLGDAVMTTPALQRLRERFPEARISLLTPEKLSDLWLRHPSINDALTFSPKESVWEVARRLRGHEIDLGLVLPNSPRSSLELWLARVPMRIGYARQWRNCFLTKAIPSRPAEVPMRKRSVGEIKKLIQNSSSQSQYATASAHHIHHYLHLAAALGADPTPVAPHLEIASSEVQQAKDRLISELQRVRKQPAADQSPIFLGLNPGAEYGPAKRWPAENFAGVLRSVSEKLGPICWLLFGAASDETHAKIITGSAQATIINLAGKTSLRELMALLKLCRVLLTNDSGPMHVAAALGTPVVVPFGSTSPALTGPGVPGDPRHQLLTSSAPCSPCFRRTCPIDFRCMTGITVDQVVQSILSTIPTGLRPSAQGCEERATLGSRTHAPEP
jgi:heptosyltransferase-2